MIDFNGKTFLVTGASAGIGSAVSKLLADLGASVIITGRNQERLLYVAAEMNEKTTVIQADLTVESELEALVSSMPGVDGMVHCAGVIAPYPIKYLQLKHLRNMFAINFDSACLLTAKLMQLKKVNNPASFVFISSISAHHPYVGGSLYAASKAALESFSRSIALEFSSKGIRSNCISAGLVKTEMFAQTQRALSEDKLQEMINSYPLGIGNPIDVANAVAFLLSKQASWITGSVINLDGGLLLTNKK